MKETIEKRREKIDEKKKVYKILEIENYKKDILFKEIDLDKHEYKSGEVIEEDDISSTIASIQMHHSKTYEYLSSKYSIFKPYEYRTMIKKVKYYKFEETKLNQFKEEIEKEEDKIFQQEILLKSSEDNNLIKKFTLVLALGVFLQLIYYVFDSLIKINETGNFKLKGILIMLIGVLIFLGLIINNLLAELINKHSNKKNKRYLMYFVIGGIIIFFLGFTSIYEYNEPKPENDIFKAFLLEQEKTKNFNSSLTILNTNYNNLENCLIELENKNQTNFKVCLTKTKE